MLQDVLTLVLAGGKGTRLEPLTRDRAKPAVPFGGLYRIVDFTLSNCINSGLRRVLVLTQYKAHSLDRHLAAGWSFLSRPLGEYIDILHPQQRIDENWYKGTADAIYQNIYSIEQAEAKYILVLSGDHIYKMDYGGMIRAHVERGADLTVGCLPVPLADGPRFGIVAADGEGRVTGFVEKPATPPAMPGDPASCFASMGIYVFTASALYESLFKDALEPDSNHDFGTDIIPPMMADGRVFAYRFADKNAKAVPYWRDVGTLDAYYQANMDLVAVDPVLNLYDRDWPIRTHHPQLPPPKFVHGDQDRRGEAVMSVVCQGCIVSGGRVSGSVLSPNVRIHSYARVESSVLLHGVDVGRHAKVRRAIVDKDVKIPQNSTIGYDLDADRARGFTVTEQGIVVIAKAELPETFAGGEVHSMSASAPTTGRRYLLFFGLLFALAAAGVTLPIVYNLNQQLKPDALAAARGRWAEAGPADYDLTFTVRYDRDPLSERHIVLVRGGRPAFAAAEGEVVYAAPPLGALLGLAAASGGRQRPRDVPAVFAHAESLLKDQEASRGKNFLVVAFDPKDGHPRRLVRRVRHSSTREEWALRLWGPGELAAKGGS